MVLSTFAAIVIWASQMTLAAQGCPMSDGIVETYGNEGTFTGAVCAEAEMSAGVFEATDGTLTVEVD